ncbi:hypothetical protein TIFTF001_006084 [Ficus carica]|uniref:F-box domain-containing protein n=1 Tax=Ficus carica TaxID=3494 RepID=A0AA88CYB8_FICCA|nr:hypothetical protein TIFTF001_006084 [Ficus carica]
MASLPWVIVVDVLCQLPVKDLLRYRTVCKAWCSLIGGPDFIKLHLKHSKETSSNLGLVLSGHDALHWLDLDRLDSPVRLSPPTDDGGVIVQVFGSCDGLLAVMNRRGDFALWNPSTRRYTSCFPISDNNRPLARRGPPIYITGLGYDPVSDDHKLFRITSSDTFRWKGDVDIYSVKTNTWKILNNLANDFILSGPIGVLVCNALHWFSVRVTHLKLTILAFDLVTETCYEVPLPGSDDDRVECRRKLVELGGCLCMVYCGENGENSDRIDVYVMKEYSVGESWTQLFTVKPTGAIGSFRRVVAIAYWKGGDKVLLDLDGEKFLVYDLQTKRAESVRAIDFPIRLDMRICVQSLIGLGGTNG